MSKHWSNHINLYEYNTESSVDFIFEYANVSHEIVGHTIVVDFTLSNNGLSTVEVCVNQLTDDERVALKEYYDEHMIEKLIRQQGQIGSIPDGVKSAAPFVINNETGLYVAVQYCCSVITNKEFFTLRGDTGMKLRKHKVKLDAADVTTEMDISNHKFSAYSKSFQCEKAHHHLLKYIGDEELKVYLGKMYSSPWKWKKKYGEVFWDIEGEFGRSVIPIIKTSFEQKSIIPFIHWESGKTSWVPVTETDHLKDLYHGDAVQYDNTSKTPKPLSVKSAVQNISAPFSTKIINKTINHNFSSINKPYVKRMFLNGDLPNNASKIESLHVLRKWMYALYPWTNPLRAEIQLTLSGSYTVKVKKKDLFRLAMIIHCLRVDYKIVGNKSTYVVVELYDITSHELSGFGFVFKKDPYKLILSADVPNDSTDIQYEWKVSVGSNKTSSVPEFRKFVSENQWLQSSSSVKRIITTLKKEPVPKNVTMTRYDLIRNSFITGNVFVGDNLRKLLEKLMIPDPNLTVCQPKQLHATLQTHQLQGYVWLKHLLRNDFGAILADDMGLGKTIQTIAVLCDIVDGNNTSLVICPSSLVYNWSEEIEKFAPHITTSIWHGKSNPEPDFSSDVIITTYRTCVNKLDRIDSAVFELLCLDEGHMVKNSSTQAHHAIASISSARRIILTGTPVENKPEDLWSLMDITMPGYLGKKSQFNKMFVKNEEYEKLRKVTRPFLLRRTKSILKQLQSKQVHDVVVPMRPKQIEVYNDIVAKYKRVIQDIELTCGGNNIQRKGTVLGLITKLKQICNHPGCFQDSFKSLKSGKLEHFKQLIGGKRDEKTIVFTQFVKTAALLRDTVEEQLGKDVCCYLDGSMSPEKRNEQTRGFQRNSEKKVYIISLRAGGMGLNLTEASNVILYDLWWNPAVEDQAIGRAHRIGQEKIVSVYRYITLGTFEERINSIIQKKRNISTQCLHNSNHKVDSGTKWITELDLEELFEFLECRSTE